MKKIFIALSAVTIIACNSGEEKTATATATSTPANMHGYTPSYSASFAMGDTKHAETVLELWRAWDNGDIGPTKAHFADSVSFYTGDGSLVAGPLDSAFAAMQGYRSMFSAVRTVVHAIFPVKSTDKNENWVCVWGTEYMTDQNGKMDSLDIQETWRFTKDNKVDMMYQHQRPTAITNPPK